MGLTDYTVERWGRYERSLKGSSEGNPFVDIWLKAEFTHGHRKITVDGFYDDNGIYKIRFMPDEEGQWMCTTKSNCPELNDKQARFTCIEPNPDNHGPVRVKNPSAFIYEDGSTYVPIGTTSYAWIYQDESIRKQTMQTLRDAPFNKIRMCIFPMYNNYNTEEHDQFPFIGNRQQGFDFTRFNSSFFKQLEDYLLELQQLNIEVDLILFHPYDKGHWGFDRMSDETDAFYVRYVMARLSAYRHIWWSLANEYDFMKTKTRAQWDQLFKYVLTYDPYNHLRSIHNGTKMYDETSLALYDHTKPWVTHMSLQHWDVTQMRKWIDLYQKPVLMDECGYEGHLPRRWGNLTGADMTLRFWDGVMRGGFVSHGETYLNKDDLLWICHGGQLIGSSIDRLRFLRTIITDLPDDARYIERFYDVPTLGIEGEYYLQYFGIHQPLFREISLAETDTFTIEIIDTWEMTVTKLAGTYSGFVKVELGAKPYQAIRIKKQTEKVY